MAAGDSRLVYGDGDAVRRGNAPDLRSRPRRGRDIGDAVLHFTGWPTWSDRWLSVTLLSATRQNLFEGEEEDLIITSKDYRGRMLIGGGHPGRTVK